MKGIAEPEPHDLVVAKGFVVDGSGVPGRVVDVGVAGERVAELGPPGSLRGRETIDATGLVVTPGFFDIHSHADFTILADGRAHSAVLQGVTSIVTGNCGYGAVPLDARSHEAVAMSVPGWRGDDDAGQDLRDFGDYFDALRHGGVGVNVYPLVAHGTLRLRVVGAETRPATAAENADMRALARDAMEAGAVGFSTGLEYLPGTAAAPEELAAISAAVGAYGGFYATHCRNRTAYMAEAAEEAVRIAAAGGCRLQLSHFLPRPTQHDLGPYKRAMEAARDAPVDVRFDVFPFDHGPTPLTLLLPSWAREGTRAEIAERLRSSRIRRRIAEEIDARFLENVRAGIAARMYVASDGGNGVSVGATLEELSGGGSVVYTVLDLLATAGESFSDVVVVERWANWNDLYGALAADDYLIMGDGVTSSLDGALAGRGFSQSDWGYAPAMLATFVRDLELTTVEKAVHRMTMAPARQAGVLDRGRLAPGQAADLVAFDLAALGACADPARLREPPSGVREVLVNGRPAVAGGRVTGRRAGVVGLGR